MSVFRIQNPDCWIEILSIVFITGVAIPRSLTSKVVSTVQAQTFFQFLSNHETIEMSKTIASRPFSTAGSSLLFSFDICGVMSRLYSTTGSSLSFSLVICGWCSWALHGWLKKNGYKPLAKTSTAAIHSQVLWATISSTTSKSCLSSEL